MIDMVKKTPLFWPGLKSFCSNVEAHYVLKVKKNPKFEGMSFMNGPLTQAQFFCKGRQDTERGTKQCRAQLLKSPLRSNCFTVCKPAAASYSRNESAKLDAKRISAFFTFYRRQKSKTTGTTAE